MSKPSQSSVIDAHHPSARDRLKASEPALDTVPSPSPTLLHGQIKLGRDPFLTVSKRFKHYIKAVFKLGHMGRLTRQAARNTNAHAFEIAALSERNARLEAALGGMSDEQEKTQEALRAQEKAHEAIRAEVSQAQEALRAQEKAHEAIRAEVSQPQADHQLQAARLEARISAQSVFNVEVSRRLDLFLHDRGGATQSVSRKSTSDAVDPNMGSPESSAGGLQVFLDNFYTNLEIQYRGTPEEITKRLQPYLAHVSAAVSRTRGKPVLDLGCGRGEWLALLRSQDIPASGVDLSPGQLEQARQQKLDVRKEDALTALANAADDSLSAITAYHLVEHLPFEDVAWIAREAQRILAPGGLLIFETPNPRNIIVGATSFHNDPTHWRPLTDPVLSVLFETAGYHPVEVLFLNPHEKLDEFLMMPGFDGELAYLLFGPQDLALIGQKPTEGA